jgi:hypothetical protein
MEHEIKRMKIKKKTKKKKIKKNSMTTQHDDSNYLYIDSIGR